MSIREVSLPVVREGVEQVRVSSYGAYRRAGGGMTRLLGNYQRD